MTDASTKGTPDPETIDIYDTRAQDYATNFAATKPGKALRHFMNHLPEGGRVLDLGCGPGQSSAHMAAAGFHIDPVDASAAMVDLAQKQFKLPARQSDFSMLKAEASYHGIWANFSLLHAPRHEVPELLSLCALRLTPKGILHLGMKLGTGETRDQLGRRYSFFSENELETYLADAKLTTIYNRTGSEVGLAGTNDPFIILQARKND